MNHLQPIRPQGRPLSGDMSGLGFVLAGIVGVGGAAGYFAARQAGATKPLYWALGVPVGLYIAAFAYTRSKSTTSRHVTAEELAAARRPPPPTTRQGIPTPSAIDFEPVKP